ncbi:hypothetical protein ABMB68_009808 [Bradyrhizobium sp. RT4a]
MVSQTAEELAKFDRRRQSELLSLKYPFGHSQRRQRSFVQGAS